jgi:Asp-tRNA(Asn)/Glu-tRNA(Gln) amidotransferase B subunit
MNRAVWLVKKNQIIALIKKISQHYGGDDEKWLKDYCEEVIEENKDDIQKLLDACWDLERFLK